jgi:hypothetical protein
MSKPLLERLKELQQDLRDGRYINPGTNSADTLLDAIKALEGSEGCLIGEVTDELVERCCKAFYSAPNFNTDWETYIKNTHTTAYVNIRQAAMRKALRAATSKPIVRCKYCNQAIVRGIGKPFVWVHEDTRQTPCHYSVATPAE